MPRQVRGRSIALVHAFAFTAVPAAGLLARLMASREASQGWWAFQLIQTVGYYGFMSWLPTLLEAKGFDYNEALTGQFAAFVLAPVGPLLGYWSCERWQRKSLIVFLTLVLAAGAVVGCNWFSAVFHAYQVELFPTAARATGVGFTYAWSRASLVLVSLAMPALIAQAVRYALGVPALAFAVVAALIVLFGPLTNARSLEEVAG